MTAQRRVQLGLWVTIAGLILSVLAVAGGGAISYGSLEQKVCENNKLATESNVRSISNQSGISEICGKLELIIKNQERMLDR